MNAREDLTSCLHMKLGGWEVKKDNRKESRMLIIAQDPREQRTCYSQLEKERSGEKKAGGGKENMWIQILKGASPNAGMIEPGSLFDRRSNGSSGKTCNKMVSPP